MGDLFKFYILIQILTHIGIVCAIFMAFIAEVLFQ